MQRGIDKWEAAGFLGMTIETLERNYARHHEQPIVPGIKFRKFEPNSAIPTGTLITRGRMHELKETSPRKRTLNFAQFDAIPLA